MITLEPKPHKAIHYFNGIVKLHKEYEFVVSKSVNGEVKYKVESINPPEEGEVFEVIEGTILNHCTTHGVGEIKKES